MDAVDDTSRLLARANAQSYEESPSLLTVIIDTHASGWASRPGLDPEKAIASILIFINAHMALRTANKVALLTYNGSGSHFLYPSGPLGAEPPEPAQLGGRMYAPFGSIDSAAYAAILQQTAAQGPRVTPVSGVLSLALCYSERILRENPGMRARVFILTVTEDMATQYIATMNCIFAAQKLETPIDVCDFVCTKSFLQQAANFTGGVYIQLRPSDELVQYLMSAFSVDPSLREYVNLPTTNQVDFSAVCFSSDKVIDVGYVCSVCLCTMEKILPACPLCGTETA